MHRRNTNADAAFANPNADSAGTDPHSDSPCANPNADSAGTDTNAHTPSANADTHRLRRPRFLRRRPSTSRRGCESSPVITLASAASSLLERGLKHVLLRAIGPSLSQFGVPNVLADPVLELHGPGSFVTITNDNWRETQEAEIQATGIPPIE